MIKQITRKTRIKKAIPQFVGKAGQLALMAELAFRGYNVSMPEIDIGDDIFVINHKTNFLWRIQVKTSKQKKSISKRPRTTSYQFNLKKEAIEVNNQTTYLAFVMRFQNEWKFCILTIDQVRTYIKLGKFGTPAKNNYVIYFSWHLQDQHLSSGGGKNKLDLTEYLSEWYKRLPDLTID
jgi:hypothetical protein